MADTFARCAFTYDVTAGGTPPIVSTLDFAIGHDADLSEVVALANDVRDSWNTNIAPALSVITSSGHLDVHYANTTYVLDVTVAIDSGADTVHDEALAGASYRVVKVAPRPPRGKPGAMYLGGIKDNWSADGTIDPTVASAVQGRLDDFSTDILGLTDWFPVVRRNVGGTPSRSAIAALSLAPSVSFLQRRYR